MAKKGKCPEFENHERWLVSYADMVTLLFAVFVVLYSLNLKPDASSEEVAGSMQESFNKPLDDLPVERRVGPTEAGFGVFDNFRGNTPNPQVERRAPSESTPIASIQEDMQMMQTEMDRLYGPSNYPGSRTDGEARIVSIHRTEEGLSLRMLARNFYSPGGYIPKKSILPQVDKIIAMVKKLDRPVVVEGHTDSIPVAPRGPVQTNWELSSLRATHLLRYMVKEGHFPSTMLSAAGYADMKPVAPNGTSEGRTLNRRIEIKVRYTDDMSVQRDYY